MSAFERRNMSDAIELIQAADREDRDEAVRIVTRAGSAALAWTLALIAAAAISEHGPVTEWAAAVRAQLKHEQDGEREHAARVLDAMKRKGNDDA